MAQRIGDFLSGYLNTLSKGLSAKPSMEDVERLRLELNRLQMGEADLSASIMGLDLCEGRLTLTSGTPVTTADVTGATSVYFAPYKGNRIALNDGSSVWTILTFTELTLALGTLTSGLPYDVFAYNNSGVVALESLAWTSGTARATALTTQNGVLVKSGATTRRYLGTFYTTATTTTEDSASRRLLFNYYNRVRRPLSCVDTTDTWNYTTTTWRAANANTTDGVGRVACVVGWAEDAASFTNYCLVRSNAVGMRFAAGVGIDSTTVNSAVLIGGESNVIDRVVSISAFYEDVMAVGYHFIQRLEISQAANTTTWIGDLALSYLSSGMVGSVWA